MRLRRQRRFRFENYWLEEEGIHETVSHSWLLDDHWDVVQRIALSVGDLEKWSMNLRRNQKENGALHKATMENL